MIPIRLQLLGPPVLDRGGALLALPFERGSQLVALLALRGGWVARAELATLLWPQQATNLAFANLRKTLFRLQATPWGAAVEAEGAALRVQADADVMAFDAALRERRRAEALALYRGALLAGFDDDANEAWTGWLRFERDRLHAAWRAAALEQLREEADAAGGLALAARLLEADPLDEAAARAQAELLARDGQSARARQCWDAFATRLADELGIAAGAAPPVLLDAAWQPPPTSASAAAADAGFVGRQAELRQIGDLLGRDGVRLVTLTGPGGIGKTRLARQAQRELAARYPDGAAFVPLEDVADAADLAARIAHATGAAGAERVATPEQLATALAGRRLLLVLDNFEQLAESAGTLEALLAACPGLALLVTSRVRLGLRSEQLLPLAGLPCPGPEDADRVESFDAARLFVDAARRVEPALVASAEAAAIVEICARLDGLPLALELAAAWTRMLSCAAIAAELREGTELLRAADATQAPRHASIEQVFEQSWRRLSPAEREALTRLSVFQGGFGAEAARAVAAARLPVLGALVDKSLLRKEGARLSLHPLVQQLAAARLGEEAGAATLSAHAAWFHRLLAQYARGIENGERAALVAIDAELENCRHAWHWAVAQGQAEVVGRSALVLQSYHDHRGRFDAGLALLREAIDAPALRDDAALQALLIGEAAHHEYRLDRYGQAQASAQHALAVAGRRADRRLRQRAAGVLGACALRAGRLDDARRAFTRVLEAANAAGNLRNIAGTLDHLALVEKRSGRYEEALRLSLDSLAQHRRLGDNAGVALCLNNLAALYQARQDYAAAAPLLHEALQVCERDGLAGTRCHVLANLSEVALKAGDRDAALGYTLRGIEAAQAVGNRTVAAWMLLQQARVLIARGEPAAARPLLADGLTRAIELPLPALYGGALLCFGELLQASGEPDLAVRVLARAAADPVTQAPERDEMHTLIAQWNRSAPAAEELPRIGLPELLERIVAEAGTAHAALRALLRVT